jgi:hypothetical protein
MNFIFFVLAALMIAAFAPAYAGTVAVNPDNLKVGLGNNCGGNCPGGCGSCPCGTETNYADIGHWCAQYGWNKVNCCERVCGDNEVLTLSVFI